MLLLALTLACEPLGPGPYDPDTPPPTGDGLLAIEPTSLDFGSFDCLEDSPREESFTVMNRGGDELVVAGLNLIVGSEAFTADAPALLHLAPGERFEVNVRFAPRSDGLQEAQLVPNGAIRVSLSGQAKAPQARLLNEQIDLDATRVGCESEARTLLLNEGSLPLRIDRTTLAGSTDFTLREPLPAVLNPGEQATLWVDFAPLEGGAHEASLVLETNDPADDTTSLGLSGLGVPGGGVIERFTYTPVAQVDLLFVVDASTSFGEALADAAESAAQLFEALDARDVDWQVAITNPANDCYSTSRAFLNAGGIPNYSPSAAAGELAVGFRPVTGGFGPAFLEHGAAVLERTGPRECLDGFLRAGAQLQVVFLTGRADSSPLGAEVYVESMQQRVSDPSELLIAAITGDGSLCPDGGAVREAAGLTGGPSLDPCTSAWSSIWDTLARLGAESADGTVARTLAEVPVPATIEVRKGNRVLTDWRYDEATNAVVINGSAARLVGGDHLEIEYLEAIACDP